jgi:hypothetical protein
MDEATTAAAPHSEKDMVMSVSVDIFIVLAARNPGRPALLAEAARQIPWSALHDIALESVCPMTFYAAAIAKRASGDGEAVRMRVAPYFSSQPGQWRIVVFSVEDFRGAR